MHSTTFFFPVPHTNRADRSFHCYVRTNCLYHVPGFPSLVFAVFCWFAVPPRCTQLLVSFLYHPFSVEKELLFPVFALLSVGFAISLCCNTLFVSLLLPSYLLVLMSRLDITNCLYQIMGFNKIVRDVKLYATEVHSLE